MHFFTLPVIATLTSLTSVYGSVTLVRPLPPITFTSPRSLNLILLNPHTQPIQSVKRGCITYQDSYGVQRGLCAGHTALANDVSAHIKACVDVSAGTSACALDIDDVHLTSQIYWGVDDCLYNNALPGPPGEF